MVEREQIVRLGATDRGSSGVLVTLVRVEGSSYRKAGARLFTVNGSFAGTISGGCLEAEILKKAAWSVRSGAILEHYSTSFDDTSDVPYGLGCGGSVTLLLEPSGTAEFHALFRALESAQRGEASTVITYLPDPTTPMRRAILSPEAEVIYRSEGLDSPSIEAALAGLIEDAFVETLAAPQRLVILGAGDDVQPLVRMAALLGWNVTVVDGRKQLARPDRFPEAQRVLTVAAGELSEVEINRHDAVVLMTHSYDQDRAWLAAILPVAPRYLGVLGARHRSSLLVSEVSALTGLPVSACCDRIYAPVGLDLGGDGPEAIALAVIAEAQACCMGRVAGSRRLSADDVAAEITRGDGTRYTQARCALELSER